MSNQPKPSSEWTARTVIDMIAKDSNAEWNVSDAHNAALAAAQAAGYRQGKLTAKAQLAAERERKNTITLMERDEAYLNVCQQLAAEREKVTLRDLLVRTWQDNYADLQEQLAAERKKVTLATQMVQIESKRANESEQKVQTLLNALTWCANKFGRYTVIEDAIGQEAALAKAKVGK